MIYVDRYRLEKKIPIYQLVKGLMSTRNYSRLLSGETVLSFEDYSALLRRLRVPLFEFSLYLYNCRFFEYIHETNFQQAVDEQRYEEAYKIITPYLNQHQWGSVFAEKTLPIAVKYVEFQLKKCSYAEVLSYSRNIIQLSTLLKNTYLNLDDFEALFLFSGFCSIEEKRMISDFLNRAIIDNEIKILNVSVEHTTSRLHRLAIQLLTSFDSHDEATLLKLKAISNIALEYQSRAKIYGEDLAILTLLYKYYKRQNIDYKSLLTEYVLSVLGYNEEQSLKELRTLLSAQEQQYILALIAKSELKKTNLFEGGR